jgi:DNA polymerase-1
MGVDNIKVPGYEADKIVGQWVLEHKITDTGNLHLLYTTDNDYLQLVEDNRVFVIKPPGRNKGATEIVYDEDSVLREFGVTVDKLLLYRAFEGDKSDKLPGVPRFNKEKLRMLTNLASTPEELVQKAGKVAKITETEYRKLQEHLPLAETNLGISAFQAGLVEDLDSYFDPGSWDEDKLRETFEHYELKSLLKLDLVDSFRIWDNMKLTSA